jgi:hypothetical protein
LKGASRVTNIKEQSTFRIRGMCNLRNLRESLVQPISNVVAVIERLEKIVNPVGWNNASPVGDANNQSCGTQLHAVIKGNIVEAHVGAATGQSELSDTPFRPPLRNAAGCFCGELVLGVAKEQ